MNAEPDDAVRQLELLTELVEEHSEIAGDIVQVGGSRWALYGTIPVDGTVLVAEYDSWEEAHAALSGLEPNHPELRDGGAR